MLSHMVYLASPYSHPDPDVRQQRFVEVCRVAARLMTEERVAVFSPVAHGHPVAEHGGLDAMAHAFWMSQCLPFIHAADEVVVLKLDGWQDSAGVASEIQQAYLLGIPVRYIET